MITEKQADKIAEEFGYWMLLSGFLAGFLTCIGLSLLLGWYS